MAQNIYDDATFFAGYSQLPRQVHGLAAAPEWPALRAMLPDLTGKRIVDLGCGFGWFARWAREHGAASVLGLDISDNMIGRARATTQDQAIEYRMADLDAFDLPEMSFELAYSSLAFHYIEDFARLVRTVHRALVPGGHFVFSIEHPIYMAAKQPGWMTHEQGHRTWPVDHYASEGERHTDWIASGVLKFHRTLGTTVNTLIDTGFVLRHLEEFAPTREQVAQCPELVEEMDRPLMLLMAAQRNGTYES
ncbi:class I SAM-dependent methyltransferase [Steroidobacter cummioxidans]|uniref:class I SAM-dependent methyltransferase n=1 Tax=Steroidobacter cummioxidans TaxID=1803913 RepID=UPI000E31ACEE|nr:class I SAM-dependent methyltransferase [Steroidobacter cummioxidans]